LAPFYKHIDFTRYVALGDSLTAGYKDGALFYEGQIQAYPNLIAEQFKCNFIQPLLNPDSIGIGFFGNSRLTLKKGNDNAPSVMSYLASHGDLEAFSKNIYLSQGPFNNLGVPGAKVITAIAPGYGNITKGEGNYNPFFKRITSDNEKASVLSDALKINPSFFSLFLGSNDVLAYALSGGTKDAITPIAGEPGIGFEQSLKFLINSLTSQGAKGVISNLPCLTSIPFFNAIHYNALLLDTEKAELLNARHTSSGIKFHAGQNPFLIEDADYPGGMRKIEKNEFILLQILLDENKLDYLKGLRPIPKKYYLTKKQIETAQSALSSYNYILKNIAREKKLAFVDTDQLLKTTKPDRVYNEHSLSITYKNGGVFSLDGLHINPLGQALLANEFIKAINYTYDTHIHKVNITKYRGKSLP